MADDVSDLQGHYSVETRVREFLNELPALLDVDLAAAPSDSQDEQERLVLSRLSQIVRVLLPYVFDTASETFWGCKA